MHYMVFFFSFLEKNPIFALSINYPTPFPRFSSSILPPHAVVQPPPPPLYHISSAVIYPSVSLTMARLVSTKSPGKIT